MRRPSPALGLAGRHQSGSLGSPASGDVRTNEASANSSASRQASRVAGGWAGEGRRSNRGSDPTPTDHSRRSIQVVKKTRPPQRKEGGGFTIVDIMSDVSAKELDPFLIWHELPRALHRPGEMPGAPMHPHRGFSECPYAKEMIGKDGPSSLDAFLGQDHDGNKHKMRSGDFEFGQVGRGFEHEGLVDPRWTGYLHFFQLWINLPRAQKMDPPKIINCASSKLPLVKLELATVKVLLGTNVFGATSPVISEHVPAQYLDFELNAGAHILHQPPAEMETRLAYVYSGEVMIGGTACRRGEFLVFGPGEQLELASGKADAGILFIAGRRIGEPVVQHGPFVMTSREELKQCFRDYQQGRLCGRMTREVIE